MYIYILALEQDKYYVGKTKNIKDRLKKHILGDGSGWTTKYKPIDIIFVKEMKENSVSDYLEDMLTIETMSNFGINNVRGGSFVTITLNEEIKRVIKKMIASSKELCFKCNESGHYTKYCQN